MRAILLNFTDANGAVTRSFTACRIKTGVMDLLLDVSERAEKLQSGAMGVAEVRAFYGDLKAILIEIFAGQFTLDELDAGCDMDELMRVFLSLGRNVAGDMGN